MIIARVYPNRAEIDPKVRPVLIRSVVYILIRRENLKKAARGYTPINLAVTFTVNKIAMREAPEIIDDWYDYELHALDKDVDAIETAMNEIVDVTQGFGPSPEAIELFSASWY